jgi:hypothetical protein
MQVILAVKFVRKEGGQVLNDSWQISDGTPPVTGFRRICRHSLVVVFYKGLDI